MKTFGFILLAMLIVTTGCDTPDKGTEELSTPDPTTRTNEAMAGKIPYPTWAKNSTMYELNIRQFTPEGTFQAIVPHLERLAGMGVDIIWLMPVHPISQTKRKGSLGSYYAVNDFREVNPEFGTLRDLQVLITSAQNLGMKVIIDWVPHHTGWDHSWIKEHPEWYSKDSIGNIIDPINEEEGKPWGWTDVAELDLSNQDMRNEMISDMAYWLETTSIDGFRVDHAHGLPDDYWDQVSASLARLNRPIFMLAEGEEPRLRNRKNFQATYAWRFHEAMNKIAEGEKTVNELDSILTEDRELYDYGFHLYFTSNHDENSWNGTVMERMGNGHKTFAVLAATIDGMPLIYSGQEEPITKRLEFFEKDPIKWKAYAYAPFYKDLSKLRKRNKALWAGDDGGLSVRINTSDYVYAFKREKDDNKIVVLLNLSDKEQTTTLSEDVERMRNVFGEGSKGYKAGKEVVLKPWEYIVLSNR